MRLERPVPGLDRFLVAAPESWPLLRLTRATGTPADDRVVFTQTHARLPLPGGGEILAERVPLAAEVRFPVAPGDSELLHPYLGYVAVIAARWLGRDCVHAGGFVVGDRTWGFVGERGSGKSTLLASLAVAGHDVMCDDVLIVGGRRIYAGPRFLDLRLEAAERLGVGESIGIVGMRERWRLPLGDVRAEATLGGWIFLEWGSAVSIERMRASEAMPRIKDQLSVFTTPRDPLALLDLGALPAWRLTRPRAWDSIAESTGRLLDALC